MLAKVAEMVKSVANPKGSRSSKNFVFTAVSPDQKPKLPAAKLAPVLRRFAVASLVVFENSDTL